MANSKLVKAIESAAESGKFGANFKVVSVVPSDLHGEDHFASDVIFAEVKLQNGSSNKSVHVVIKRQQKNGFVRELMNTSTQFYNEVLMYSEILPLLDKNGIVEKTFPKFIFGKATLDEDYEEDIVIVEDLRQFGYRLTKEKIFLDFDHCSLVLKSIAKFHALSYAKKQENFEEFLNTVEKLKETRYVDQSKEESNKFLSLTYDRGILLLENEGNKNYEFLDSFKKKFEDPFEMAKSLCQPEEPVAVLCHGDFCRNNMIFQYDSNGKPVDVRFFDVATARYASPAIDLVFFLFMNTSTELRQTSWDDLLEVYHEALSTAVSPPCTVPSLDTIRQEISSKALYGYSLCSFFIPMMMEEKKVEFEDFSSSTPEEIEAITRDRGGEKATKIVTDIVRDIIRMEMDCF